MPEKSQDRDRKKKKGQKRIKNPNETTNQHMKKPLLLSLAIRENTSFILNRFVLQRSLKNNRKQNQKS